ncbi:MAG: LacI family DNA-binding transcriptional regulator [Enterocloster aldenensis]
MADTASNKPVTIKSIAKELGISFSTVSKALNNNPLVKEETRRLVLDSQGNGLHPQFPGQGPSEQFHQNHCRYFQ